MGWVKLSGFIKDPLEIEAHKGLQLHGRVSLFPKYFVSRDLLLGRRYSRFC